MEGEFKEMFLTVVNTVSLCDMLLNVISLSFYFFKFCIAKKKEDTCFTSCCIRRFDLLGKSDFEDGSVEIQTQQDIFTVDIE